MNLEGVKLRLLIHHNILRFITNLENLAVNSSWVYKWHLSGLPMLPLLLLLL